MGTFGRTWRTRVLWIPLLTLVLVSGAAALVLAPRWGALQGLLTMGASAPTLHTLPQGLELVEGGQALGFERALIARPEAEGPRPVLIFVSGIVDEHGIENPRVVQGADVFRKAGHIVFVPEIVMFVDPARPENDLDMLVALLHRVADGAITGSRKQAFGVVGISLGGALALRAVADFRRDGGRGCRAALTIGAPANLYAEAQRWFEISPPTEGGSGPEYDRRKNAAFARNVMYRAALPSLVSDARDRATLKAWLDADWEPKVGPPSLGSQARSVAQSYLGGLPAWKADRDRILKHAWGRMRHCSPVEWRTRFSDYEGVSIFLLHGIRDSLISIASLGHLQMYLSRDTMTVALRSELIGHAEIGDVSLIEKLRHVAFLDDFFDMVGG